MQPRTCPNCEYTYPVGTYLKKAASADLWTEWTCPNCGTQLRVDKSWRRKMTIASAFLVLILMGIRFYIRPPIEVYIGLLLLLIGGTVLLFTQDRFVRAES